MTEIGLTTINETIVELAALQDRICDDFGTVFTVIEACLVDSIVADVGHLDFRIGDQDALEL